MPISLPPGEARAMDPAAARNRLVGALADQLRNPTPEGAYAAAVGRIEALHTCPAITDRQARTGTLMILDALVEALVEQE
jgi:hypothetical protein